MTRAPLSHIPTRFGSLLIGTCLAAISLAATAAQPASNTLDKIRQTRTITLGVRTGALPFSSLDGTGQAMGYSVDICNKVVEQIRKELTLADLKVARIETSAADRIQKLKSGTIDIECGTTVNTKTRQAEVAFSYPIFIAGQRILIKGDATQAKLASLNDKTVGVTKGSTSDKLFSDIKASQMPKMNLVTFRTNQEALAALDAGKIYAFVGLDVVQQGLLTNRKGEYGMSKESLSVEPIALMLRKDDPAFRDMVDKAVATLFSTGEIHTIYAHWFKTDALNVPMSVLLRDSITHPSHEPGISKIGYML